MTSGACVDRASGAAAGTPSRDFDGFVREHQGGLVRYAALLSGSRPQGEDLVQEVLIRLYPRWDQLADPLPYVRRSVTNEFLSWRRRWSTRHIAPADDADLDRAVEVEWDTGPDPALWASLTALPPQQRAAVVLRYYEGLPDDEIAAVLSCREGTVRAHVSRGLATLRAGLTSDDLTPNDLTTQDKDDSR